MTKTRPAQVAPTRRWPGPRCPVLFGLLAGGVLLLASCGGSPGNGNAAVAHLGSAPTTRGSSSQASSAQSGDGSGAVGGPAPAGGSAHSQFSVSGGNESQLLAYSHCMQTHGVPNFPDPNGQGVIQGSGNMDSPSAQAARSDCRHLLPHGGTPTPAQAAQAAAQALKFTQCMRRHGIADFPDPKISGGGAEISISLGAGKSSDLNPQNSQFQAAQKACQGFTPFKGAGKLSTNGGAK
jgi:hypothetical protein